MKGVKQRRRKVSLSSLRKMAYKEEVERLMWYQDVFTRTTDVDEKLWLLDKVEECQKKISAIRL